MSIRRLDLIPYRLPLRHPWRSAHGSFAQRAGWLLRLELHNGQCGWGDCAPLVEAGTEDHASAGQWLARQDARVRGRHPRLCLRQLADGERAPVAARAALECALLDLQAQAAGVSLAHLLDWGSAAALAVNANAGALDGQHTERVLAAVQSGFRVIKLKLGLGPVRQELPQLVELAQLLPQGVSLRLDANGAWSMADARWFVAEARELPIESLEEPLQAAQPERLAQLQGQAGFPLAADESLLQHGLEALLRSAAVRRVVLKPAVQGGLVAALEIARRARDGGLECVVTSLVDSAAGVWAAAHLAAAVDGAGPGLAHGLDTGSWLSADTGVGPPIHAGVLALAPVSGLGFVPHPAFAATPCKAPSGSQPAPSQT